MPGQVLKPRGPCAEHQCGSLPAQTGTCLKRYELPTGKEAGRSNVPKRSQDTDVSGSGDYQAGDLESREVKFDVGSLGSAIVNVSDELDAGVIGGGSVGYIGNRA